jgi:hypothetical protein
MIDFDNTEFLLSESRQFHEGDKFKAFFNFCSERHVLKQLVFFDRAFIIKEYPIKNFLSDLRLLVEEGKKVIP